MSLLGYAERMGESSFRCVPRLSEAMAELMRPAQISLHRTKSASCTAMVGPLAIGPNPDHRAGLIWLDSQPHYPTPAPNQSPSHAHSLRSHPMATRRRPYCFFFLRYTQEGPIMLVTFLSFFFYFLSSTSLSLLVLFFLLLLPTERDGYYPSFIPWKGKKKKKFKGGGPRPKKKNDDSRLWCIELKRWRGEREPAAAAERFLSASLQILPFDSVGFSRKIHTNTSDFFFFHSRSDGSSIYLFFSPSFVWTSLLMRCCCTVRGPIAPRCVDQYEEQTHTHTNTQTRATRAIECSIIKPVRCVLDS